MKEVTLFTDGSCSGNPGPGGWACILRYGKHERILRGVEPHTTNNRMELVAAINGLRALTEACRVTAEKPLRIGICGKCWRRWLASTKRSGAGSAATDLIQTRTAAMFSRKNQRER